MSVSLDEFRVAVRAPKNAADVALQRDLDAAMELINARVYTEKVPEALLDSAHLEVAANIYRRRVAVTEPVALGQNDSPTPVFHRPALDPFTPVSAQLRPWSKLTGVA